MLALFIKWADLPKIHVQIQCLGLIMVYIYNYVLFGTEGGLNILNLTQVQLNIEAIRLVMGW